MYYSQMICLHLSNCSEEFYGSVYSMYKRVKPVCVLVRENKNTVAETMVVVGVNSLLFRYY